MSVPLGIRCVAPSRVAPGEEFSLRVKLLGPVRAIACRGNFNDRKPALHGPFNLNVQRQIQYHDNCLPAWRGKLAVEAGKALSGPAEIIFDGERQGVFPGDQRPIQVLGGFRLTEPGIHFLRLIDRESGVEGWSNPVCVTPEVLTWRIFWGDPHWQTFFSDGIRCPEELYAFARDEGFLDFGAISDHMEGVTDRQWDYFQAVTNDFNDPGRFATLLGQEWTHHDPRHGAPGHRNIYYRGDGGPALRSNDPDCDSLAKLWRRLDGLAGIEAIAIPHHTANVIMGVDWDLGWNPKYEQAVEIHSVWGSSECHADDGNPMPIHHCNGEERGRHVIDALKRGYRFGFVGGGDIHDGRPGDQLHKESYPPRPGGAGFWPEGFTAVLIPELTREAVFDAIRDHRTYATTQSRIYLDAAWAGKDGKRTLSVTAASEEGVREVVVVRNGENHQVLKPGAEQRVLAENNMPISLADNQFCYVRVLTGRGNMAWSSPVWA